MSGGDAKKGAGGVCGKHGLYDGLRCPDCSVSGGDVTAREAARREMQSVYAAEGYHGPHDLSPEQRADILAAELEAAEARTARLTEALREIASYDEKRQDVGCRCGHKMAFCHAVNAATWCGGHPGASLARHTLGECPPVCWVCIRNESLAASRKEQSE